MAKLTPSQLAKQKAGLSKFHEDGKKGLVATSAGSIKPPRSIVNIRTGLTPLTRLY